MRERTILIVDDEISVGKSLRGALEEEGYLVRVAVTGKEALEISRSWLPHVMLLDIWLPDTDGISILNQIRKEDLPIQVIVMSGHGTVETAVKATKLGAFDFLEKPISLEKLLLTLQNTFALEALRAENRQLREKISHCELIGQSAWITGLMEKVKIAAPTNSWVLISGENGTGKELVARTLHEKSLRKEGPFIEVNCAAIPDDLIESELFGFERGAFTGAVSRKRGKFELADGGTLFLDEIGDMSLKTQAKILRILQEQQFQRIGGSETICIDVRIIAATNKDLPREISRGLFREDLYYRLNVIPLMVPSLRERRGDIPLLVEHFLGQIAVQNGRKPKRINAQVLACLQAYHWPGNVRELKNTIERMFILSSGEEIQEADLPPLLLEGKDSRQGNAMADTFFQNPSLRDARGDFERAFILRKLEENGGNITKTAEAIGLERSHLHRKIKLYEIESS